MKKIKVVIDQKGNYEIETLEGYAGTQCVNDLQHIVVSAGGQEKDEKKKDDYYKGTDNYINI